MSHFTRLDAPSVAPMSEVLGLKSFRAAVVAGWNQRRVKNMTRATLCELTGMRPAHVTDYLSDQEADEKGRERRQMPAKYLPAFEQAIGNSFATQWLAMQSQLTILEAQIAEQKAAIWKK